MGSDHSITVWGRCFFGAPDFFLRKHVESVAVTSDVTPLTAAKKSNKQLFRPRNGACLGRCVIYLLGCPAGSDRKDR